ncbi:MAG: fused MFS/spermidine synthase [Verrucomicrobiales bacterium]
MSSAASNSPAEDSGLGIPRRALFLIFTLSGISALLYQLIWQRALLTIFGSNIESVTMVVSAFMLGLGIGSIVGGYVSKMKGAPLLLIFAVVEILIGLYGAISLHLFRWVGESTTGAGSLQTGLLTLTLILIPTLLMGSTLPLLVAHYVNVSKNVGYSVSMLYFVNTLGAGIGALLAAFVFLGLLGLTGSVYLAVALNLFAGITILHFRRRATHPTA